MIKKYILLILCVNSGFLNAWYHKGLMANVIQLWCDIKKMIHIKSKNTRVFLLSANSLKKSESKVPSDRFDISGKGDCRGFGRRRMKQEEIQQIQRDIEAGLLSVNATDICDDSPSLLEYAIMIRDVNWCKFLIKNGANVQETNLSSYRPIFHELVYLGNDNDVDKAIYKL